MDHGHNSWLRRIRSLSMAAGAMVLVAGMGAPGASAAAPSYPMGFHPEATPGHTTTFTPPVTDLKPACPQALAGTPGSDPATKLFNPALNTATSFEVGGTVHYVYRDNPRDQSVAAQSAQGDTFRIQDCVVVYPSDFFKPSDFNSDGVLTGAFSKHDLVTNGTVVDAGQMRGIVGAGDNIYFSWTMPAHEAIVPGAWVCNFARDVGRDHSPGANFSSWGNRKVTPVCFRVQSADLSITKTGPATSTAGDDIAYTVTATNTGSGAATTVVVADTVPANTTFVSAAQTAGPTFTCTAPAAGATTGTISCSIATLAAGASATFRFVFNAASTVADKTVVTNTAAVTAGNVTADDDDQATATTTVNAPQPVVPGGENPPTPSPSPVAVLGIQISRPPAAPTAVQGATLAATGFDALTLALIGIALIAGGSLLLVTKPLGRHEG